MRATCGVRVERLQSSRMFMLQLIKVAIVKCVKRLVCFAQLLVEFFRVPRGGTLTQALLEVQRHV